MTRPKTRVIDFLFESSLSPSKNAKRLESDSDESLTRVDPTLLVPSFFLFLGPNSLLVRPNFSVLRRICHPPSPLLSLIFGHRFKRQLHLLRDGQGQPAGLGSRKGRQEGQGEAEGLVRPRGQQGPVARGQAAEGRRHHEAEAGRKAGGKGCRCGRGRRQELRKWREKNVHKDRVDGGKKEGEEEQELCLVWAGWVCGGF
jgi:hypothetical protein